MDQKIPLWFWLCCGGLAFFLVVMAISAYILFA